MIVLFVRRVFEAIPVLWGAGTLVFFLIHAVPGDPVDLMIGESAQPANREALRASLNLDKPMLTQYAIFWRGVVTGNFGQSFQSRRPVSELIAERLPATAALAILSLLVAVLVAIPLGVLSAKKHGHFLDQFLLFATTLGVSFPNFWLGPLLVLLFSVQLGLLPVSEMQGPLSFILPMLTLGISLASVLIRMTRAAMLEVLRQNYINVAAAQGIGETSLLFKHALRNALIPVITVIGLQLGGLLSGTVITETIFDWPGIGELLFRGIQSRDYPLVQGCVLVISCVYVFANLLADVGYQLANPRLREKA
jgi:peptide/nickel transport system permease protein